MRDLFWSYLFWGSAKWHLNLLVQNILNWLVNWFLNLLVRNVIEREIKREKVQMKPPILYVKHVISISICNRGLDQLLVSFLNYWHTCFALTHFRFCLCILKKIAGNSDKNPKSCNSSDLVVINFANFFFSRVFHILVIICNIIHICCCFLDMSGHSITFSIRFRWHNILTTSG